MKLDSVFSNLLEVPFPDDVPLIPVPEINRALDAIEQASSDRQVQLLTEQTDSLLQRATPFLVNRDAAGIAALEWNLGVALQAPIFSVWSMGWQLGSAHMIREMAAAVPVELRQGAGFTQRFASPQEMVQVAALMRMEPGQLINTPAEQAVLRRTIQLAGNFSNDQLANVKLSLIAAISPDKDGKVLSRKELLDQIQQNLQVGKARSEMIARTELTNAYNTSRVQTALQSELVTHFRFLAINDARTTPICRTRNGMLISISDQAAIANNKPPLHVRCRSTLSPVMATINPIHQQWAEDPERDWQNRTLEPLPKGWQTGELPKVPSPAPAPAVPSPPPAKPKKTTTAFPRSIDKLETVRSLGGSTGATLVRDPKTDRLFVLKRGSSADHLREEFAADKAYQALGVPVPKAKLYETATGPVKLAEYVEGRSLKSALATATDLERQAILKEVQQNFAADALLGNWDVVGLDYDNILVDGTGKAWRIDNGGSLRYRAQGALKGDRWNKYPTELFSLRDAVVNPQTADVYGEIKHFEVMEQMRSLAAKEKALLKALPQELHETIQGRFFEMRRQLAIADTLKADKWTEGYIGQFSRHSLGFRSAGIVDRLPDELRQSGSGVTVVDKAGKKFDDLRGKDSHMLAVRDYINSIGGDYTLIEEWMAAQAGSSWSSESQAFKYFIANNRTAPTDSYFWLHGEETAKQNLLQVAGAARKKTGDGRTYVNTFVPWHAFNYEMMDRIDFNLKNAASKTIQLIRTENKAIMELNSLTPGGKGLLMKRGVAESTSIYKRVTVYGTELTEQQVPYHRVLGNYFYERHPGQGGTAFMGDGENEFVTLLDDIPFNYVGKPPSTRKKKSTMVDLLSDLDLPDFSDLLGD